MNIDIDYYAALSISKTASTEEIKAAYRKLSKELHPDRNRDDPTANEKFNAIAEAYSVLKDDNSRSEYDSSRNRGRSPGRKLDPFYNYYNGQDAIRGSEIILNEHIHISDLYKEKTIHIHYNRSQVCETCKGNKIKPGAKIDTCSLCSGKGTVEQTFEMGGRRFRQVYQCPSCQGNGVIIPKESVCESCNGTSFTEKPFDKQIDIPKGIRHGQIIHFPFEGNLGMNDGPPGDLYVRILVNNDTNFQIDGYNLYLEKEIPYHTLCLGGKFDIELPDKSSIKMTIPKLHDLNKPLKGKSRGLPFPNDIDKTSNVPKGIKNGDLFVKLSLKMPSQLSEKEVKLLKEMENIYVVQEK